MILYQIYHAGFLGSIISHRLSQYPNEQAALLVGKTLASRLDSRDIITKSFKESCLFDEVFCYDDRLGTKRTSLRGVYEVITNGYDECFKEINLDLSKFKRIIISVDTYNSFGIYMGLKKIPHFKIEPHSNGIMDDEQHYKQLLAAHPEYEAYFNACLEFNKAASPIFTILPSNSNYNGFEMFDVTAAINNFGKHEISIISSAFQLNDKQIDKAGKVIVALRSNILDTKDESIRNRLIYNKYTITDLYHLAHQYLFDYYLEDKIIVLKPHPQVPITENEARKYYPGIECFPAILPIEFISVLRSDNGEHQYDAMFTTSFTSFYKITELAKTSLTYLPVANDSDLMLRFSCAMLYDLNRYFFYLFNRIHTVLDIVRSFFNNCGINIRMGIDNVVVQTFIASVSNCKTILVNDNANSLNSDTVYIFNDHKENPFLIYYSLITAPESAIVFFLDHNEVFCEFFHEYEEIIPWVVPVTIHKSKNDSREIIDLAFDEKLYVFCKRKDVRQMIMGYTMHKCLKHTGIDISVLPVNELEIKIDFLTSLCRILKKRVAVLEKFNIAACVKNANAELFEAHIDKNCVDVLAGWVWIPSLPSKIITVFALDENGTIVTSAIANMYRPDVERAGYGDGRYGYRLQGVFTEKMSLVFISDNIIKIQQIVFL